MFPTSVIRKLARSEEMFARSKTFFGSTIYLKGPIDVEAMTVAFETLLQAHPVLAGQLECGPDGMHQIVVDDLVHPGIWVVEGEDGAPRTRLDHTASLADLRLKLVDGGAEVTLFTHHSLTDGYHNSALMWELFSWYTDVVCTGRVDAVVAEPAPKPLESCWRSEAYANNLGQESSGSCPPCLPTIYLRRRETPQAAIRPSHTGSCRQMPADQAGNRSLDRIHSRAQSQPQRRDSGGYLAG